MVVVDSSISSSSMATPSSTSLTGWSHHGEKNMQDFFFEFVLSKLLFRAKTLKLALICKALPDQRRKCAATVHLRGGRWQEATAHEDHAPDSGQPRDGVCDRHEGGVQSRSHAPHSLQRFELLIGVQMSSVNERMK